MEEIHYAYWLNNIEGIGCVTAARLTEYAGSCEGVWKLGSDELSDSFPGLSAAQLNAVSVSKDEQRIMSSFEKMTGSGVNFTYAGHPDFPSGLKCIQDAPQALYYRGRLPSPDCIHASIVGARTCSDYGRYVARKLGGRLAEAGIQVISGMALGIDGVGQLGALECGGYSCAVLGCGPEICYPSANRKVYDLLLEHGGIISEYPPGTDPKPGFFPRRNRIISGLSDIVIVVEARERSGSLITADIALEQGKDVYAVPGRVTDALSHGCNRLIRQGAGIITSPEEFLQDLEVSYGSRRSTDDSGIYQLTLASIAGSDPIDTKIMTCVGFDPVNINKIQDETGLGTGELMNHLMKLSMRGLILQKGSHYVRAQDT